MWFSLGCLLLLAQIASAQVLSTSALSGKYFARHLQFTTDNGNSVTDTRSIVGVINFDGAGNYAFTGQQSVGTAPATAYSVSGTYAVTASGIMTLTNPQRTTSTINARYAVEAVIGSSTEAAGGNFDIFAAIPAPVSARPNTTVQAAWTAADFELTAASTAQVRSSLVALSFDASGNISSLTATGHSANFNKGLTAFQSVTGPAYNLAADGSGSITFPVPAGVSGASALLGQAPRTLYLSKSGNVMLAGTPGGHDLFIAVRNAAAPVTLGNGQRFWTAGLRVDSTGSSNSHAGAASVATAENSFLLSRRLHQSGAAALNFTSASAYNLAPDGTGSAGATKIAVGQASNLIAATDGNAFDPTGYEIAIGTAIPSVSGPGVFVNPQGIFNAASNAPAGDAVSPGEFIALYGSGLAAATTAAKALPFPASLGGVTVSINGLPAPIYFVSAGQIDCIVPYKVTGQTATIVVTNNGVVSNTVSAPLAPTSPGVFTLDGSGAGDGSITHADGSIVNASSPAKRGETVVLYASGLGLLTNPVSDGSGASALNNAIATVTVYVAGLAVPARNVLYQGLTASAGLYQINFVVPTTLVLGGELPVALQTPDGFTDMVNLAVQ